LNSQIDTGGWGGGGSWFSDKTISVMGKVVIPLSKVCDYLIYLRFAIMLIAGLFLSKWSLAQF
jgi:hypothetical protein